MALWDIDIAGPPQFPARRAFPRRRSRANSDSFPCPGHGVREREREKTNHYMFVLHDSQVADDRLLRHALKRLRCSFTAFFVFVYCLFSASFASRRARRRAVLVRTASLLASYSRIASAASCARPSFAVIAASCWAFFNVVAIGIRLVTTSVYGCISAGILESSSPPSFRVAK